MTSLDALLVHDVDALDDDNEDDDDENGETRDTSGDATAASLNDDADQLAGLPTLVDTPILVEADAPANLPPIATAGAEAQLISLDDVDLSAGSGSGS